MDGNTDDRRAEQGPAGVWHLIRQARSSELLGLWRKQGNRWAVGGILICARGTYHWAAGHETASSVGREQWVC